MLKAGSLIDKFKRLDFRTSKAHVVEEVKPEISDHEREDNEIEELGQKPEAETLLKRLRSRVDELEALMTTSIHSHPDMCAIQGAKQEVRAIITQLEGKEKEDGR